MSLSTPTPTSAAPSMKTIIRDVQTVRASTELQLANTSSLLHAARDQSDKEQRIEGQQSKYQVEKEFCLQVLQELGSSHSP
ncbi:hypothetical protein F66182_10202 [Fusarium sp. NRRL 66182]|nr:hypothetical protein F66182_10202 [Fusarium sp. NRRL 66182]